MTDDYGFSVFYISKEEYEAQGLSYKTPTWKPDESAFFVSGVVDSADLVFSPERERAIAEFKLWLEDNGWIQESEEI